MSNIDKRERKEQGMHPAPVCRRRSGGTSTDFILRATRGKRSLTGLTLRHKHNPDSTLWGLAFYNGRTILHAARIAGEHALTTRFHGSKTNTVFVVRLTCCMAAAATGSIPPSGLFQNQHQVNPGFPSCRRNPLVSRSDLLYQESRCRIRATVISRTTLTQSSLCGQELSVQAFHGCRFQAFP